MCSRTGCTVRVSALPGPSGSGSVKNSPSKADASRARRACSTIATYSRVRASGLSNRTPCQPSETWGPETPRPRRNRPPESVSRVAAVIAVMAGVRAGIWKMAEPTSICSVCAATQASTRGGVGAVGLGRPGDGVSEAVGLAGEREVVGVVAGAPVAEVDSEPHAGCPRRRRPCRRTPTAPRLRPLAEPSRRTGARLARIGSSAPWSCVRSAGPACWCPASRWAP